MKWDWYIHKFRHLFPPHRCFGGWESTFCKDRGEWVYINDICIHCEKYGEWDGANLDCKDHWEWLKKVDEYEEPEPEPDDEPLTEYGEILQKWFEEGQENEAEEEEKNGEDAWQEFQSKSQGIREILKKIKDGIFGENEEDEEEDDEDEEETYQ